MATGFPEEASGADCPRPGRQPYNSTDRWQVRWQHRCRSARCVRAFAKAAPCDQRCRPPFPATRHEQGRLTQQMAPQNKWAHNRQNKARAIPPPRLYTTRRLPEPLWRNLAPVPPVTFRHFPNVGTMHLFATYPSLKRECKPFRQAPAVVDDIRAIIADMQSHIQRGERPFALPAMFRRQSSDGSSKRRRPATEPAAGFLLKKCPAFASTLTLLFWSFFITFFYLFYHSLFVHDNLYLRFCRNIAVNPRPSSGFNPYHEGGLKSHRLRF